MASSLAAGAERLAVDRDHAAAVLAGRFGDHLLDPCAEPGDPAGEAITRVSSVAAVPR